MKVCFSADDYPIIAERLKKYAVKYGLHEVEIGNTEKMFGVRVFCTWWDEEKETAVLAYEAYIQGRWGAKTRFVCALITKSSEGDYFLHIYY